MKKVTLEDMQLVKLYFHSITDFYNMIEIGDFIGSINTYEEDNIIENSVLSTDLSGAHGCYRFIKDGDYYFTILINFRTRAFSSELREEVFTFIDRVEDLGFKLNTINKKSSQDYSFSLKITIRYSN